jgi:hypothetical protein
MRRQRRGRTTMFGFDPDGTDVPPVIQRGQGVSGARRGRCAVRLEEEWAAEGNPRPLATGTFYIGVVVWGGGLVVRARGRGA